MLLISRLIVTKNYRIISFTYLKLKLLHRVCKKSWVLNTFWSQCICLLPHSTSHSISQHPGLSTTFFVEVEVLQALVQVAGGGGSSDVGVGVHRSQAWDGRAVPYWSQVTGLWTLKAGAHTVHQERSSIIPNKWKQMTKMLKWATISDQEWFNSQKLFNITDIDLQHITPEMIPLNLFRPNISPMSGLNRFKGITRGKSL